MGYIVYDIEPCCHGYHARYRPKNARYNAEFPRQRGLKLLQTTLQDIVILIRCGGFLWHDVYFDVLPLIWVRV